jgi:hypothetical protein
MKPILKAVLRKMSQVKPVPLQKQLNRNKTALAM